MECPDIVENPVSGEGISRTLSDLRDNDAKREIDDVDFGAPDGSQNICGGLRRKSAALCNVKSYMLPSINMNLDHLPDYHEVQLKANGTRHKWQGWRSRAWHRFHRGRTCPPWLISQSDAAIRWGAPSAAPALRSTDLKP